MFDDSRPIYLQVAGHISDEILAGALEPHDRVMSTNEYAEFFRINPATAAKGISLLVDEGVLYKRRGVGMFVTDEARDVLFGQRRRDFLSERIGELVTEARLLDIGIDELVDHVRRVATTERTTTPSTS